MPGLMQSSLVFSCVCICQIFSIEYMYTYLGCYKNPNHFLDTGERHEDRRFMSARKCVRLCGHKYEYAGTENAYTCRCSNEVKSLLRHRLTDSRCQTECAGNANEICGDLWRISLYKINYGHTPHHANASCPHGTFKNIPNLRVTRYVIQSFNVDSLVLCAVTCKQTNNCQRFNVNQKTGECKLLAPSLPGDKAKHAEYNAEWDLYLTC